MKSFLGVLMFSEYHKLPQEEMYLSLDLNRSTFIVCDKVTRQRYKKKLTFERYRQSQHR